MASHKYFCPNVRTDCGVRLLICDEASRIPDLVYYSVRPSCGSVNERGNREYEVAYDDGAGKLVHEDRLTPAEA